ncbi:hypothetical protein BDF20DRAFT_912020 [Mycotypha africana]|uniref:uncharacterized protein n=1 Tax=Mycotypha africana TaxID=64632 RepID=UPI002301B80A|nr:uncharacterized protein BDF20DRAFT_912020 [Mycotypha africana]KAI8981774.1 hypothetical protein BDF20DRAFT_912020 [Mycotypha africana]
MASSSAKSLDITNFFSKQSHFFEANTCNYLPNYYEQELAGIPEGKMTFRSISSKRYPGEYNSIQEVDMMEDHKEQAVDDWSDDLDALYEATLLSSDFLDSLARKQNKEEEEEEEENSSASVDAYVHNDKPLTRLRQLLEHLHPSSTAIDKQQQQADMSFKAFSMLHYDVKGKRKL